MPLSDVVIPDSLHEWARLNEVFERRCEEIYPDTSVPATPEQSETLRDLETEMYPAMAEAWEDGLLIDRFRVEWRMLRQAWKDRHDEQGLTP